MLSTLKSAIIRKIDQLTAFAAYSQWRSSYLAEVGWYESFRQRRSINGDGKPLPWITYPAIAFLDSRLTKSMAVFEYGCGNSTLWLAERVGSIVSCEHESVWYHEIRSTLPTNAKLLLRALDGGYASAVASSGQNFDVIIIDGRDRNECVAAAVSRLKQDGVIILDNSERADYAQAIAGLTGLGFSSIAFDGPGPIISEGWRTTVFYRSGMNCLGI